MRVAALDCGTNSTRLLILDHDGTVRRRENVITRLGDRVDSSARLADDAQQRVVDVVRDFARTLRDDGVERARLVGTSAVRQAANGQDFMAQLHEILGFPCDIIEGHEEARLSFLGARGSTTAVGLAGTMATLAHLELGADDPDPRYPGFRFPATTATTWREILAGESIEQRAAHRGMRAGREGVIVTGLMILEEICARWQVVNLVAGEADILDGVAGELRSN